jgi:hypothetical protein
VAGRQGERWSIDRLIPYAKNARTHTEAQVVLTLIVIPAVFGLIKGWGLEGARKKIPTG